MRRRWWAAIFAVLATLGAGALAPATATAVGLGPVGDVAETSTAGARQLEAFGDQTCGLHDDGTVTCWGATELADPPAGAFEALARGGGPCVLRSGGAVECWGDVGAGVHPGPYSSVAAGRDRACAIGLDATLTCWGGSGTGDPFDAAPAGEFRSVAVVGKGGCAIRTDGAPTCWGLDPGSPVVLPPTTDYVDLSAGGWQVCARRVGGTVECWGTLGSPTGSFTSIAVGPSHACGIGTDGTVGCWGKGDDGETLAPGSTFAAVTVGLDHSCGARPDGTVECWGSDRAGQLRPPSFELTAVVVGSRNVCGLARDRSAACWNHDEDALDGPLPGSYLSIEGGVNGVCAVLTDASASCFGAGSDLPAGSYRSLSVGNDVVCAIRTDRTLGCRGWSPDGVASPPPGSFVSVAVGHYHACAIRIDRSVACWGDGSDGQASPPQGPFVALTVGDYHTCGLRPDGSVACWGWNGLGQASPPPGAFHSIAAGWNLSCGVRADGAVACWGRGDHGADDPPAGAFVSVAVGNSLACGIRADGVWQCWGAGYRARGEPFTVAPVQPGAGYHPVAPTRLLDSRVDRVGFRGPVVAGTPRSLAVTNLGGPSSVPPTASAVVLNVTATDSTTPSFLTVFPTGSPVPATSNLNFGTGQVIPNLVTTKVGAGGAIDIATAVGSTHVVADLVAWYDDAAVAGGAGDGFTPLAPTRILDSRTATGGWGARLVAGAPRNLVVTSPGAPAGVPADASAVVANVTVTGGTAPSFVTVWPAGGTQPGVSNLNLLPGQTIPNLVVVGVGAGGAIRFANNMGGVHVIVDVLGYFGPGGSRFHPLDPTRFLDTRTGLGLTGSQGPGQTRTVGVAGRSGTGVPADATGLVANLTVADGSAESFVAAFPGGSPRPNPLSNLNFGANQAVPNLVMVGLGANGDLGLYNHLGHVALIGDAVGYFAPG